MYIILYLLSHSSFYFPFPMDKLTRAKFCKEFFVEMKSAEGDKKVEECKLCPEGGRKRFLIARGLQTDYMAPDKHQK